MLVLLQAEGSFRGRTQTDMLPTSKGNTFFGYSAPKSVMLFSTNSSAQDVGLEGEKCLKLRLQLLYRALFHIKSCL